MNRKFISVIHCPEGACNGDVEIVEESSVYKNQIIEGIIECQSCRKQYSITDGIPVMLPEVLSDESDLSSVD